MNMNNKMPKIILAAIFAVSSTLSAKYVYLNNLTSEELEVYQGKRGDTRNELTKLMLHSMHNQGAQQVLMKDGLVDSLYIRYPQMIEGSYAVAELQNPQSDGKYDIFFLADLVARKQ